MTAYQAFSEKIDVITEAHDARIEFFSEKLMESEQVVGQLAKSMENSFLLVDELQSKAGKEECTLPVKHVKEEATVHFDNGQPILGLSYMRRKFVLCAAVGCFILKGSSVCCH